MPLAEIAFGITVVALLAQVVSAYRDGDTVFQQVKRKRRERRAPPPPNHLEHSLQQSQDDIEKERMRGVNIFGDAFNIGDHQAIIEIQQILIQLQGSMLQGLRLAALQDDFDGFMALAHDADMARNRTIGVLIQLQQRLMLSAPVVGRPLVSPGPPQQVLQMAEVRMQRPPMLAAGLGISQQYLPSRPVRHDSFGENGRGENPNAANRHHFPLFRKQSRPHLPSQEASPEPDKFSLPRVYTIPAGSNETLESSPVGNNSASQSPMPQARIARTSTNYNYEDWEDDPAKIWGNHRQSAFIPPPPEPEPASLRTSRSSTSRSNSSIIPNPTSMNKYLGYCKGAVKLQNGERKAMSECRDFTSTAQSSAKFLQCSACHFQSSIVDPKVFWKKIFRFQQLGLQVRWAFLAKSHVKQTAIPDRESAKRGLFCYQCLFCVFLGDEAPVIQGITPYLQHIHQHHRGTVLSDVILHRTGCVIDRICDAREEFDINFFPMRSGEVVEIG